MKNTEEKVLVVLFFLLLKYNVINRQEVIPIITNIKILYPRNIAKGSTESPA